MGVTIATSGSRNFNLRPSHRILQTQHPGQLSGGDARCATRLGQQPCRIIPFAVHHDGQVEIEVTWGSNDTDLDVDLYEGAARLANSDNVRSTREFISSAVRAGLSYEVRVYYWRGSQIEHFNVRLRRPN